MASTPLHQPVLRQAVLDLLGPLGRHVLVDCTVGGGGHAKALLEAAGVRDKTERNNPNKAKPGKKAQERAEEKAAKAEAIPDGMVALRAPMQGTLAQIVAAPGDVVGPGQAVAIKAVDDGLQPLDVLLSASPEEGAR